MLLNILVISMIVSVAEFIITYNKSLNYSLKLEEEFEVLYNNLIEISKITDKELIDSEYGIYEDTTDKILELEKQKRNVSVVQLITSIFLDVTVLYAFGLYLYKKNKI